MGHIIIGKPGLIYVIIACGSLITCGSLTCCVRKKEVDYAINIVSAPSNAKIHDEIVFDHEVTNVGSTVAPKGGYSVYLLIRKEGTSDLIRTPLERSGSRLLPGEKVSYSMKSGYHNWIPSEEGLFNIELEVVASGSTVDNNLSNNTDRVTIKVEKDGGN